MKRNNQKQVWVDPSFHDWMIKLKAKKVLNGSKVNNTGELSREIMQCQALEELERELLKLDRKLTGIRMEKKDAFR